MISVARRPHQTLPPPKGWPRRVRSAAVHAIALARLALTTARGQANSADPGSGRIARLTEELFLIKEEMRIKDARMASIPAQRRPHCLILASDSPVEALAASFDTQPMVEMPQLSASTFGGLVQHYILGRLPDKDNYSTLTRMGFPCS